jgi:hypothetical protein
MTVRSFLLMIGMVGLSVVLCAAPAGEAQAPAKLPPGVDVLARGAVHEAFAQPQDGQPGEGPIAPKAPPPAIEELPPDQKPEGDNVQWIPGYWQWDEETSKFVWISGTWRVTPPGRQWVPGRYRKTDGGYQWVPGFWGDAGVREVPVLPTPPATVESGPSMPAPTADSVYVPGCWVYRDTRFLWRPGYFMDFRPGWVWVPAHYVWTPAGYVFVNGYWDYPLDRRGLLFTPALIDPAVIQPGWSYTPTFVVSADFLPSALFVRPRHCHYFFGDYFGPRYNRCGFTAWLDFRIGRNVCDPLFSYYRCAYGGGPWERDLRALYVGRVRGTIDLPPRTLVQQNALIRTPAVAAAPLVTSGPGLVASAAPLVAVTAKGVPTVAVTRAERLEAQKAAGQLRDFSRQRAALERRLVAAGTTPAQPGDRPLTLNLNPPVLAAVQNSKSVSVPPPPKPIPTDSGIRIRRANATDPVLRDPRLTSSATTLPGKEHHSFVNPRDAAPSPPPPTRTFKTESSPPPPTTKDAGRPPRILKTESFPALATPPKRDAVPPPPPPKIASPPPPPPKVSSPPPPPPRITTPPPPPKVVSPPPPPPRIASPPPPPPRAAAPPPPPPSRSAPPPSKGPPPAKQSSHSGKDSHKK